MSARGSVAVATTIALLVLALAPAASPTRADTPTTRVSVTIDATVVAGKYVFVGPNPDHPDTIVIPAVPAILTVTVKGVEGTPHTFTIRSTSSSTPLVDLHLDTAGETLTTTFTVYSASQVIVGSRNETTETLNGGIKFVCTPHEALGMVGSIVVGGVAAPTPTAPEKGVFLRAYWIGAIGMIGALVLIGAAYFVIKSSSRHFRDEREHVRRGLP